MIHYALPGLKFPVKIESQSIVILVCDYYKVNMTDVLSKNRKRDIVKARAVSMYLMHTISNMSLRGIGKYFGNMDHTSATYLVNKIKGEAEIYPDMQEDLANLETKVQGSLIVSRV